LCWWCDPEAPVRLPVLHEQAYASLAGTHCTFAVHLDGMQSVQQEALLGALERAIEEDQSLKIECAEDAEVQLTACGSEQLRRLRHRLHDQWGVELPLRPYRIAYQVTLRHSEIVQFSIAAGASQLSASIRLFPVRRGRGVRVLATEQVLNVIGYCGLDAFAQGINYTCSCGIPIVGQPCADHPRCTCSCKKCEIPCNCVHIPVADVGFELLNLEVVSPYFSNSLPSIWLYAVGVKCLEKATKLSHRKTGGTDGQMKKNLFRLLEPVMRVSLNVPPIFMRKVVSDIFSRGGQITALRKQCRRLVTIEATVSKRRLRRYGQALAALCRSTATFKAQHKGYAEVSSSDAAQVIPGIGKEWSRPPHKTCPLTLWQ